MRAAMILLIASMTLAGESAHADDDAQVVFGPRVADVLRIAYRTAGLDRTPARSWVRRGRLAGLMPWVSVRTGRDTRWEDAGVSGVGHSSVMDVRATWRLDRLVFDGHELQVATIEAARRRERRRLATRVIRAYFMWRRAVVAAERAEPGEAARRSTRAEEAVAELDALTDGWFSTSLGGSGGR